MSHQTTVIGAIVALCLITAATVIALALGGPKDSTPFVSALVGILAPTVVALLALLKADSNSQKIDTAVEKQAVVHEEVNGRLEALENGH